MDDNGQDQPLEAIYRQYRQGLFSLAMAITSNAMQAEDAVHDAFTRMCRAGRFFPIAYVFAAVRNAARDQLRLRRNTSELNESIYDNQPTPERAVLTDETCQIVRQEIAALADDQREVVVMKVYGELTFDQIAQTLGEPLQTVASRYRRAMQKLKEQLGTRV